MKRCIRQIGVICFLCVVAAFFGWDSAQGQAIGGGPGSIGGGSINGEGSGGGTGPYSPTTLTAFGVLWGNGVGPIQAGPTLTDANGDLMLPSTATTGVQIFNTTDMVTNVEKLQLQAFGNQFIIQSTAGGTGTKRDLVIRMNGNGSITLSGSSGLVTVASASNANIALTPNGSGIVNIQGTPFQSTGSVRTTGPITITSSTALANISGLSVSLAASGSYHFRAHVPTTAAAAGGIQMAIAYSGSVSYIWYEGELTSAGVISNQTRATSMGSAVCSSASATAGTGIIEGNIITTTAASLTVQAAQNTSNASATTIIQGAELDVWRDNN